MTEPIRLCEVDDLDDGEIARVEIDGRAVAYARIDGRYHAIDDTCTHARVSLADGIVDEDDATIECPKHGAVFSLETGAALTLPATRPVARHEVRVVESEVFVTITTEDEHG